MVEALIEQVAMDHLAELAGKVPADQAVIEIGTHHAANLANMAHGAKAGNGARCYGVDPYGSGDIYRGRPHMLKRYTSADLDVAREHLRDAKVVKQTSIIVGTSTEAAVDWTGPKVGLLVIDAEHRKPNVLADFRAWQPHLADGAVVAFDDYEQRFHGVIEAVTELVAEGAISEPEVIGTRLAVCSLA